MTAMGLGLSQQQESVAQMYNYRVPKGSLCHELTQICTPLIRDPTFRHVTFNEEMWCLNGHAVGLRALPADINDISVQNWEPASNDMGRNDQCEGNCEKVS
jgi:hypothetical protein